MNEIEETVVRGYDLVHIFFLEKGYRHIDMVPKIHGMKGDGIVKKYLEWWMKQPAGF